MKIKLLTGVAGDTFSYTPGSIVEVDEDFAKRLIQTGQAEPVSAPAKRTKRVKGTSETR